MKISKINSTKRTMVENKKGMDSMKEFERMNNEVMEEMNEFILSPSYGFDMSPLYRLLLAKCGEDIPTLIVLDELPDEFISSGYGFVSSTNNPNKLILLLERHDIITMKSILAEAISAYQNQDSLEFAMAYNPDVELGDISDLAHVKSMYEHALKIASMLKIACPQIIMQKSEWMDEGQAGFLEVYKDKNKETGMLIVIRKDGRIKQLSTLAHELRHCWQHTYGKYKGFTDKVTFLNADKYFYHKTEIDAEAFSCKYVKEYKGYADISPLLTNMGDDDESRRYIQTILQRMEEISLAA